MRRIALEQFSGQRYAVNPPDAVTGFIQENSSPATGSGNASKVVLLVDDDVFVQFFVWKLLKADGFTVLPAGSGESALETCRSHHGSIDLLLTDMQMSGMNGLELYSAIAAERPGITAVIMSGDPEAREQSARAGLPFLQKPFHLAAMRETIQTALGTATAESPAHEGAAALEKYDCPGALLAGR